MRLILVLILCTFSTSALAASVVSSTTFQNYTSTHQVVGSGTSTGTNTGDVTIGTGNGLSLSGQAISLQAATNSVPGALTAADHTLLSTAVQPGGGIGAASGVSLRVGASILKTSSLLTVQGGEVDIDNSSSPALRLWNGASMLGGFGTGNWALGDGTTDMTVYSVGKLKLMGNGVTRVILDTAGAANHTVCWKSDGKTLGYCSTAVASDGTCTCN